jgi:hypothetical protein
MRGRILILLAAVLLVGAGLVWAQSSNAPAQPQPAAPMGSHGTSGSMMGGSTMGGSMMGGSMMGRSMMGGSMSSGQQMRGSMMGGQGMQGTMAQQDRQVMAQRHAMMDRMNAMNSQLDSLVHRMDRARGSQKVDAIAAVVHELVAQRGSMWNMMDAMQPMMMQNMMRHMQMGMMNGMNQGMQDSMSSMPGMGGNPQASRPEGH